MSQIASNRTGAAPRLVTGPEAVKQMHSRNQTEQRRDQWPYPWLCPPESAFPVFRQDVIVAPAVNALTEVLEYTVPSGFQFCLEAIVQMYSGSGYVPGDGDIQWTLDVDAPIGVASLEGFPLAGLNLIYTPLGGFTGTAAAGGIVSPWKFPKPFILKPNQVLRSKVFLPTLNPLSAAPNAISAGFPNLFISVFSGFTYPV
jgi:hypothetical protein